MKKLLAALLCLMLVLPAAAEEPEYVVRYGDRAQHRIAITVDDIYDADVLRMMHELSVEHDVPFTYFVLGTQIREGDRDIWEDVIARGGEIGTHT